MTANLNLSTLVNNVLLTWQKWFKTLATNTLQCKWKYSYFVYLLPINRYTSRGLFEYGRGVYLLKVKFCWRIASLVFASSSQQWQRTTFSETSVLKLQRSYRCLLLYHLPEVVDSCFLHLLGFCRCLYGLGRLELLCWLIGVFTG